MSPRLCIIAELLTTDSTPCSVAGAPTPSAPLRPPLRNSIVPSRPPTSPAPKPPPRAPPMPPPCGLANRLIDSAGVIIISSLIVDASYTSELDILGPRAGTSITLSASPYLIVTVEAASRSPLMSKCTESPALPHKRSKGVVITSFTKAVTFALPVTATSILPSVGTITLLVSLLTGVSSVHIIFLYSWFKKTPNNKKPLILRSSLYRGRLV